MVDASYPSYQWWPLIAYYILFILITPVYLIIFICLLKLRRSNNNIFKSSFYTLLLQHIITDVLSLVFYTIHKASVTIFSVYLYTQEIIPFAQFFFDGVYWSIIFRSHGITLLTIHRYLMIVKPLSRLTQYIKHENKWIIFLRFWIPPLLFNCFFFLENKIRFDLRDILIFAMDTSIVDFHSKVILVVLTFSCLICFVSYVFIIFFVRTKAKSMTQSVKRELRLALQMSLPCAALLGLFLYMIFLNTYASNDNSEMIQWIRGFFPLINGILSFIGPFTILLFNKELIQRIKEMVFGKQKRIRSASITIPVRIN